MRATRFLCLADHSADCREYILHAVIEFSIQGALMLLCSLALGDINVDAHHPLRAAITVVRNENARIDSPNFAT